MTNTELILSLVGTFVGGSFGGAFANKILNKEKDKLEKQLKEQVFYKSLIEDMTAQHEAEKNKISSLEKKIDELTKEVHKLVLINKEKDRIIKDQDETVRRWENNCVRLEGIIKHKDKQIVKLTALSNNED